MKSGQSLIELLIALGIFVVVVAVVAFLIINGYFSNLQASQNSRALFLAEEGMEAVRSIRDFSWKALTAGNHGLAIFMDFWIFEGDSEDISDKLNQGKRIIAIEDLDKNRKKIISKVIWQTPQKKESKIELVTYFTNWAKFIKTEKRPRRWEEIEWQWGRIQKEWGIIPSGIKKKFGEDWEEIQEDWHEVLEEWREWKKTLDPEDWHEVVEEWQELKKEWKKLREAIPWPV